MLSMSSLLLITCRPSRRTWLTWTITGHQLKDETGFMTNQLPFVSQTEEVHYSIESDTETLEWTTSRPSNIWVTLNFLHRPSSPPANLLHCDMCYTSPPSPQGHQVLPSGATISWTETLWLIVTLYPLQLLFPLKYTLGLGANSKCWCACKHATRSNPLIFFLFSYFLFSLLLSSSLVVPSFLKSVITKVYLSKNDLTD